MRSHALPITLALSAALLAGCGNAAPRSAPADPSPVAANGTATATATASTESAMTTDNAAPPAEESITLTLDIGASARLPDGSQLTYMELVNDSRCPPDVRCIWAGNAEIRVRWTPEKGSSRDFSLNTMPVGGKATSVTLGKSEVHLQSLERGIAPAATFAVKPAR